MQNVKSYINKWLRVAVTGFPLLALTLSLIISHTYAGPYETSACSVNSPTSCYMTIPADSLGDIHWDPQSSDCKVIFRKKSSPDKIFKFEDGANLQGAKGSLAILLTAATNGLDVRVYITSGAYNNNGISSYFKDVVLVPYSAQ